MFTICFDTEQDKEDEAYKDVNKAIQVILDEGVNRVYIVTLPIFGGGKTDPDSLIREKGVEAFKTAINEAQIYYQYRLQFILNRYTYGQEAIRGLTDKQIDNLLEEIIGTSLQIPDTIDRERYINSFTSLQFIKDLGISKDSLSITIDRLTSTRDKETQT